MVVELAGDACRARCMMRRNDEGAPAWAWAPSRSRQSICRSR